MATPINTFKGWTVRELLALAQSERITTKKRIAILDEIKRREEAVTQTIDATLTKKGY